MSDKSGSTIINFNVSGLDEYNAMKKNSSVIGDLIERFVDKDKVIGELAENILLYDKVYIETDTFSEAGLLLSLLGTSNFERLLASDSITFIHTKEMLAYVSNDPKYPEHIIRISLAGKYQGDNYHWGSDDPEIACEYTLRELLKIPQKKAKEISRRVGRRTVHSSPEVPRLYGEIIKKAIDDDGFLQSFGFTDKDELNRLDNNRPEDKGKIQTYLRIVNAVDQAAISHAFGSSDYSTQSYYTTVIDRIIKSEHQNSLKSSANTYLAYNNIPSIANLVISGNLSIQDVIELRNSENGVKFRKQLIESWKPEVFQDGYRILGFNLSQLMERTVVFLLNAGLGALYPQAPFSQLFDAGMNIADVIEERNKYRNSPAIFVNEISKRIKQ